ncbi:Thiol:disulfide interchange protein DsbC (modular protein) [Burkholderiales bacterium]|nr:Thiol:disulfide interchange protein DsbC (modular protein) [Burkholderiales bacterium]
MVEAAFAADADSTAGSTRPASTADSASPAAPAAAADADGTPAPAAGKAPAATVAPLASCPPVYGSASSGPLAPISPGLAGMIRDRIRKKIGGTVTSVCRTPFGLYEVVVDAEVIYVDERVNYLVAGNAFDLRTQENLTAKRKEDVTRIDFKTLPLQLAVKTVRGSGSRLLAVFEDPNCPYCRRFEKSIASLTDTTIYTFLYPILSRDASVADDSYPKSKSIWCAPDRGLAWSQVMLEGKHLAAAPEACQHPLEEILALGQKLHITGTPTLVFSDGRRAPGAIPLEQVEQMLSDAARSGASQ